LDGTRKSLNPDLIQPFLEVNKKSPHIICGETVIPPGTEGLHTFYEKAGNQDDITDNDEPERKSGNKGNGDKGSEQAKHGQHNRDPEEEFGGRIHFHFDSPQNNIVPGNDDLIIHMDFNFATGNISNLAPRCGLQAGIAWLAGRE
jgi:hypothetical protein